MPALGNPKHVLLDIGSGGTPFVPDWIAHRLALTDTHFRLEGFYLHRRLSTTLHLKPDLTFALLRSYLHAEPGAQLPTFPFCLFEVVFALECLVEHLIEL